LESLQGFSL